MSFTYGVIEGLYDQAQSWAWQDRKGYIDFCCNKKFNFYIYAPKNDPYLRELWREPWPEDEFERLKSLSRAFQARGIDFGIGFTPYEVKELDSKTRRELKVKIDLINSINPSMLAILFDDFSNDTPGLARVQCDMAEYIAGESTARHFQVVGTYYSRDPLLLRAYGAMPENYWVDLGRYLDQQFDIYWTGDHVISLGYDQAGIEQITEMFQRKPFLWDNYPVNDPAWLQGRLRIFSFTGRPWRLSQWCSGHAVNPLIQPRLSMIPLATLADIYQQKDQFVALNSFKSALHDLCGQELAGAIYDNLIYFTEEGVNHFSDFTKKRLRETFSAFDRPDQKVFTSEILRWLSDSEFDQGAPGD
ncbi:protein O-GlcNAcase [Endozoicomonas sp. Mp262]|uniref:protein O-GlcNAcase n=1 Tax=Endozoicomonas sp. Mp262 TaxID=2919499 RepID=UPI0021DAB280